MFIHVYMLVIHVRTYLPFVLPRRSEENIGIIRVFFFDSCKLLFPTFFISVEKGRMIVFFVALDFFFIYLFLAAST